MLLSLQGVIITVGLLKFALDTKYPTRCIQENSEHGKEETIPLSHLLPKNKDSFRVN